MSLVNVCIRLLGIVLGLFESFADHPVLQDFTEVSHLMQLPVQVFLANMILLKHLYYCPLKNVLPKKKNKHSVHEMMHLRKAHAEEKLQVPGPSVCLPTRMVPEQLASNTRILVYAGK